MRATLDEKLQQMLGDMARARELTEREEWEEAKHAYLKLRATCARNGIRSAHVAWCLAVVSDALGDFDGAMGFIREATEIDPLAIPYQRSYNVIVERIRKTLGDEDRQPDDPTTPKLYELLLSVGEGDVPSHLAMARYLHHKGDFGAALRILDAISILAPSCRQAWTLKAAVARGLKKPEVAQQAEIEAASLAAHDGNPFGIRPTARG